MHHLGKILSWDREEQWVGSPRPPQEWSFIDETGWPESRGYLPQESCLRAGQAWQPTASDEQSRGKALVLGNTVTQWEDSDTAQSS